MFPENDIIFTSVWPWILIAACAAVALLLLGGSLCDMLLLILATLAVRLLFEIIERRRAK